MPLTKYIQAVCQSKTKESRERILQKALFDSNITPFQCKQIIKMVVGIKK